MVTASSLIIGKMKTITPIVLATCASPARAVAAIQFESRDLITELQKDRGVGGGTPWFRNRLTHRDQVSNFAPDFSDLERRPLHDLRFNLAGFFRKHDGGTVGCQIRS